MVHTSQGGLLKVREKSGGFLMVCCVPSIASLPLPRYVVRGDLRAVLQHKLMLLFCVGIVHTNLYSCIS